MAVNRAWDVDVIIVGGGAVGATLALSLDRLGFRVALIERRKPEFSSSNPERVIALNAGSRIHLERLGLWEDIAADGVGVIRRIEVMESGNAGRVELDAADIGAPSHGCADALGYVVEMERLLASLYRALAASSVQQRLPASLRGIRLVEDGIEAHLHQHGSSHCLRAALLIGADGSESQVRRLAGITTLGWDYNRFALTASLRCERAHAQTAFECFRAPGPLAFLPLADGRYSIVWVVRPAEASRLLEMDDAAFIDALQCAGGDQLLARTGAVVEISPRASFPLQLSCAGSFTAPRLALVGNAAHTVHPVAGQGMNLGLRDVETLARALDSEPGRRDPGQSIVLSAYAEQRRLDVLAVTGFTEAMVGIFGATLPGAKYLRGKGLQAMQACASLKRLLIGHAAGLAQLPREAGAVGALAEAVR